VTERAANEDGAETEKTQTSEKAPGLP
jgi:hypothetical protein